MILICEQRRQLSCLLPQPKCIHSMDISSIFPRWNALKKFSCSKWPNSFRTAFVNYSWNMSWKWMFRNYLPWPTFFLNRSNSSVPIYSFPLKLLVNKFKQWGKHVSKKKSLWSGKKRISNEKWIFILWMQKTFFCFYFYFK